MAKCEYNKSRMEDNYSIEGCELIKSLVPSGSCNPGSCEVIKYLKKVTQLNQELVSSN
tara:strand:- start:2180 stop:2353 length:174 start_codon:yes stop_codon:yes gene_type:complete